MDINTILIPVGVLGALGILFAVILSFASRVFFVPVDERIEAVRNELPGANCGACGFPGCDGLAGAIINNGASLSSCPVGGADLTERLSALLGLNAIAAEKKVVVVKCQGSLTHSKEKYEYSGINDCRAENALQGGHKACSAGCLGCGTCVEQCQFDALHMVNGVALVDRDKCTACELCIPVCPKNLIELVPYSQEVDVLCSSYDSAKVVRENCSIGCIACKICERNCPVDAIVVNNNLARIDYDICINCGMCVVKCPTSTIKDFYGILSPLSQ